MRIATEEAFIYENGERLPDRSGAHTQIAGNLVLTQSDSPGQHSVQNLAAEMLGNRLARVLAPGRRLTNYALYRSPESAPAGPAAPASPPGAPAASASPPVRGPLPPSGRQN